MGDVLAKCAELLDLLQRKIAGVNEVEALQVKRTTALDVRELALNTKSADLDVRAEAVQEIEDVAAQKAKNEADAKQNAADLAELKVQREGYAAYLATTTKDIEGGLANLKEKQANLEGDKAALQTARQAFLDEMMDAKDQLSEERANLDVDRKKIIDQMNKG
jgi:chromosome segregation ATPase